MHVKIAARKSDLARLQARLVGEALLRKYPGVTIEYAFSESLGDKNLTDPLWKMPQKGVFTSDLSQMLLRGDTDLVVHSWKDLPIELEATVIAGTLLRADARDILFFKKKSRPEIGRRTSIIFSSSPRREFNLGVFLPGALPGGEASVEFKPVRGNVQTRLRKMIEDPGVDGLVLAKAAIDRLLTNTDAEFQSTRETIRSVLQEVDFMILPLRENPTAPGQGALAIECRKENSELIELIQGISDPESVHAVQIERDHLKAIGGGCHQKYGCTVIVRDNQNLKWIRGEGIESPIAKTQRVIVRSNHFFQREALPKVHLPSADAVWVAHSSAWTPFSGVVWTAGSQTWRQLARQGVWVNGCAEGLGESEDPRLEDLAPGLRWLRFSHDQSTPPLRGEAIATYRLIAKDKVEALPEADEYVWSNALVAQEAVRRWPWLEKRRHFCGPGKTFALLTKIFPGVQKIWQSEELT